LMASSVAASAAEVPIEKAVHSPNETILDVLVGLLDNLHDPSTEPPTPAVSMAALTICEEMAAHLRSIVQPARDAAAEKMRGRKTEAQRESIELRTLKGEPSENGSLHDKAAPSPLAVSSSAPSDATSASEGAAPAPRANRLSKKTRDRLRRQQVAADGWATQAARQSEDFRHSLWNHGWQMAPTMIEAVVVQEPASSQATFVDTMWSGGWQMVPVHAPPWAGASAGGAGPAVDPRRPCTFFVRGTCRDGANCRFSHAVVPGAMHASMPAHHRPPIRAKPTRTVPCTPPRTGMPPPTDNSVDNARTVGHVRQDTCDTRTSSSTSSLS